MTLEGVALRFEGRICLYYLLTLSVVLHSCTRPIPFDCFAYHNYDSVRKTLCLLHDYS